MNKKEKELIFNCLLSEPDESEHFISLIGYIAKKNNCKITKMDIEKQLINIDSEVDNIKDQENCSIELEKFMNIIQLISDIFESIENFDEKENSKIITLDTKNGWGHLIN